MTDSIADMLTRIRNALAARHSSVTLPYSKIKESIAEILKSNHFVLDYRIDASGQFKTIVISLDESAPTITTISRISKPSRRIYAGRDEIPSVLGGRGIIIVSTSGGVMTNKEARKRGLGGELICKVW